MNSPATLNLQFLPSACGNIKANTFKAVITSLLPSTRSVPTLLWSIGVQGQPGSQEMQPPIRFFHLRPAFLILLPPLDHVPADSTSEGRLESVL